jgi:hypothetical protein
LPCRHANIAKDPVIPWDGLTEEEFMVNRSPGQNRLVAMHWLVLAYLVLLALNIWLLWVLPSAPPIEKVSFILAILGIYSLALSFSSETGLSKAFPNWLEQMTSPILRDFAAAAFRVTSMAFLLASLFIKGFPPPVLSRSRFPALLLALPLALGTVVTAAVVAAAYLVVIAPLAYSGYVLASIFLGAIENAPDDFVISSEDGQLTLGAAIRDHRVQLRTLAVGVPAAVVGIGASAYSLFA